MKRYIIDRFGHALATQSSTLDDEERSLPRIDPSTSVDREYLEKYYVTKTELNNAIFTKEYLDQTYVTKAEAIDTQYLEKNYVTKTSLIEMLTDLREYVNTKLEKCLQINSEGTGWDCKEVKLIHVGEGLLPTDASIVSQTCTYDVEIMNFRCGNKYFNLVEHSANEQIVCFTTNEDGEQILAAYNSGRMEVKPTAILRWNEKQQVLKDYKDKEVIWDERKSHFRYIDSHKSLHSRILPTLAGGSLPSEKNDEVWDGKNLRFTNVAAGRDADDVATIKQVLIYDEVKDVFKCGSKEFDLAVNKPKAKVVVLRTDREPILTTYKSNDYESIKYEGMMNFNWRSTRGKHYVRDYKDREIKWDERQKSFIVVEQSTG